MDATEIYIDATSETLLSVSRLNNDSVRLQVASVEAVLVAVTISNGPWRDMVKAAYEEERRSARIFREARRIVTRADRRWWERLWPVRFARAFRDGVIQVINEERAARR
jgi:hypothetical protein